MQAILAQTAVDCKRILPRRRKHSLAGLSMTKALGAVLRQARTHMKLTQDQVAKRLGVSRAAVGQWENGDDPSTENLIGICKELGIEVESAIAGNLKHLANFQAETPKKTFASDNEIPTKVSALDKYPYNLPNYFIENKLIPFYPTFRYKNDMYIEITQDPMFFSPREIEFPNINELYLVSVVNTNMEPIIPRMSMVLVDGAAVPSVGDIVLLKIDNSRLSGAERAAGTRVNRSQSAVIGYLDGISTDGVVISQINPQERTVVPAQDVDALHRILPPRKP